MLEKAMQGRQRLHALAYFVMLLSYISPLRKIFTCSVYHALFPVEVIITTHITSMRVYHIKTSNIVLDVLNMEPDKANKKHPVCIQCTYSRVKAYLILIYIL